MRKQILIVRLDAIGDYILFRNVLRTYRESNRYREAHITILGNPAWRSIAEAFDSDCADEWIWVDNRSDLFRKSHENLLPHCIWHRRVAKAQEELRVKIKAGRYDEVLSLQLADDPLIRELLEGTAPIVRFACDVPKGKSSFVFLRNREVASEFTGEQYDVRLSLPIPHNPSNYILFFTGASHWTRRWPIKRCLVVARHLPCPVLFAGGPDELQTLHALSRRSDFPENARVYPAGKSLVDFLGTIAKAKAVVSNDTMAFHAAAALGTPAIALTNGESGRGGFWPYPHEVFVGANAIVGKSPRWFRGDFIAMRQVRQALALRSISTEKVITEANKLL